MLLEYVIARDLSGSVGTGVFQHWDFNSGDSGMNPMESGSTEL